MEKRHRSPHGKFSEYLVSNQETILSMRQEGKTVAEIADALSMKHRQIEYLLKKYDLPLIHQRQEVIIGNTYGCWLAVEELPRKEVGTQKCTFRRWLIECVNCSFRREVYTHAITHEAKKFKCSYCGLLPKGESGLNALFYKYKKLAEKKNRQFLLTKEQFKILTSSNCVYCGSQPSDICTADPGRVTTRRIKSTWGDYVYNGVDRIDSSLGYTSSNCASCCKHCNWMKRNMSYSEWLNRMKQIIANEEISTKLLQEIKCSADPSNEPALQELKGIVLP